MRKKSSEWAASANVLLRAPHQLSHDPFLIPPSQTRQSGSRSSPRDQSARSVQSERRHRGRSRAARDRERRQRSQSGSSVELRMAATNFRTGQPESGTQKPVTDRIPLSLFRKPSFPDKRGRPSRNSSLAEASAWPLLPE